MRSARSVVLVLAAALAAALPAAALPDPAAAVVEPYAVAVVWVAPGDPAGLPLEDPARGVRVPARMPVLPAQRARPPHAPGTPRGGTLAALAPNACARRAPVPLYRTAVYRETAFGRVEVTFVGS